jgi:indole-3-glycerol phosphate synthase
LEENWLTKIVEIKKARLERLKQTNPLTLEQPTPARTTFIRTRSFYDALDRADRLNLIAEIKKASPSKGVLREEYDPVEIAIDYESHGAAALSVLTEEDHFQGSLEHLKHIRPNVSRPLLRKDFIFDPYQIREAAAAGADAVLLIVAILDASTLGSLVRLAEELGLDALVEVHNLQELNNALGCRAKIIGINNRDLTTFKVDLHTTLQLAPHVPDSAILVSESGIHTADDIRMLRDAGCDAFLIGEAFLKTDRPGRALRELMIRSLNLS